MVFKCAKGMYQLQKNYRDAFNLEAFIEKYLEECFDKDMYIVGDISSEILRLKGFDTDPKSKNYFGFIDDYLDISCAFGCPYYVLKRIRSEEEYAKLERKNDPVITDDDRVAIKTITKENFDKESLVLKTSHKGKPNIVIDPRKMNAIPIGSLPQDLKDDSKDMISSKKKTEEPTKEVNVQTFVSASEDFDPSKKEQRFNKSNRPNNNRPKQNNKPQENKNNPNPKPKDSNASNRPKENLKQNAKDNQNTNQQNKEHFNHKNKNKNKNRGNGPKPEHKQVVQ